MTATAKTPTVAIARVLRSFGLKQGQDFRVRGQYQGTGADRMRTGTYVAVLSGHGDQVVADNADAIEELVQQDGGFSFSVSIHFTANGRMWTWIANYGQRTRDAAPAATVGRDDASQAPSPSGRKLARDLKVDIVAAAPTAAQQANDVLASVELPTDAADRADALPKLKLGKPRPAFQAPDAHPYDGLAQKRFGSLYWACEEAGRVWFFQDGHNTARYTLTYGSGDRKDRWYLTGPGLPDGGTLLNNSVTMAAEAAEDIIMEHKHIADGMERAGRAWPKGTRVRGLDSAGVLRTGTVNGVDVGMVVEPGHDNYGRTFVGVNWDAPERPESGHIIRNRPFTDTLTRI